MAHRKPNPTLVLGAACAVALSLTACSSGGGSSSGQVKGFELSSISVPQGAIWEINRPIVFEFSEDVDFSSVSLNSITIRDSTGAPANGEFILEDPRTVVFQPTCPTTDDFSDAGFSPGGVFYTVSVLGEESGALAVQSASNQPLQASQTRNFTTPTTLTPSVLFVDQVVGPPAAVIRPVGSTEEDATYLEIGADDDNRIYFEFDPGSQTFTQPTDQPLNLFSDVTTEVAYVLEINQPVNPASSNINSNAVFLEFEEKQNPGSWLKLSTGVELVRNCTQTGATLRLEPQGILPQDHRVRAVISPSFEDLVGERNLLPINNFGILETLAFSEPSLVPSGDLSDEVFESFDVSGTALGSFEDTEAAFGEPRALWGDGQLKAAFEFSGAGGPGGDFDVLVPNGVTIQLDTTAFTIFGGPNALMGANSTSQTVINGKLDVRNLMIEAGGVLRAQGPNPLIIQATGDVEIRGNLIVDGTPVNNVATLNTGNQPETGASGNCGGGRGGTASFLTTTSTPKGGNGFGANNIPNIGGRGGESGFSSGGKNNRRPGGGGGSFGPSAMGQGGSAFGLVAEPGHDGNPNSTSAITFTKPAKGGLPAPLPFIDEFDNNDFFGTVLDPGTGSLVFGELQSIFAASGGGAGGDAIPGNQFPSPNWIPASDEKGAGGGGGAGGLEILCLGEVRIAGTGRITANGGDGGSGENTIFNDRVGGGSGGGGGGHIVIQANLLNFAGSQNNAIQALGGRGGAGANETFNATNGGGDGGPGIIQVHATNLNLPGTITLQSRTLPDAIQLLPLFGAQSRARSVWIPVGGASLDPLGGGDVLQFTFGGIDTMSGDVQATDGIVDDVPAILGPVPLAAAPVVPFIAADARTLVVDAMPLANTFDDIYLRNTQLLKNFILELRQVGSTTVFQRFNVASASYDSATTQLSLTIPGTGPDLNSFTPTGGAEFRLIPRFFRVVSNATPDSLPSSASITLTFEGAAADVNGQPDDSGMLLVPATSDVTLLNDPELAFFRFEVLFDIAADGSSPNANSPQPALEFLRIPFRF